MLIEFLVSKLYFVVPMAVGAATFMSILRYMSMGTGITRTEAKEGIKNGNIALAIYFSCRIIGVAIVVGSCVLAGAIV